MEELAIPSGVAQVVLRLWDDKEQELRVVAIARPRLQQDAVKAKGLSREAFQRGNPGIINDIASSKYALNIAGGPAV